MSLAEGNQDMISAMWEHNLSNEFITGISNLNMKGYQLKLMNDDFSDIAIDIISANQVLGANIDRRKNLNIRKIDVGFAFKGVFDSIKVHWPNDFSENSKLKLNIEVVIKFKTDYKLNVFDENKNSMIPYSAKNNSEIHYVRFESLWKELNLSFKELSNFRKGLSVGELDFADWTITDFDRVLYDNPHI